MDISYALYSALLRRLKRAAQTTFGTQPTSMCSSNQHRAPLRLGGVTQTHEKMAALSSDFSDLVQIKKQLISMISQCKARGLVHSVKW